MYVCVDMRIHTSVYTHIYIYIYIYVHGCTLGNQQSPVEKDIHTNICIGIG